MQSYSIRYYYYHALTETKYLLPAKLVKTYRYFGRFFNMYGFEKSFGQLW